MALGFLMVAAITNLGIRGIAVVLGGIFPQWIFYQTDIMLYEKYRLSMENSVHYGKAHRKELVVNLGIKMILIIIFLFGIVTESYLNPYLFEKLLEIF